MSDNDPIPASPLQFDKAEYTAPEASASACGVCGQSIAESYYTVNAGIVCDQCRGAIEAYRDGGSRFRRALAATAWGLLAGLAGAAVWFAVRRTTGYEIGLIAIVVGVMVGLAVRKGSRGRGGWFYQTLAIAITYSCITAQYVPDIVEGFVQRFREGAAETAQPAAKSSADKSDGKAAGESAPTEKASPPAGAERKPGIGMAILALGLFLVLAFILSLAVPFLGGAENIIGLLIIGFALFEAWRINKRVPFDVAGPFRLAPPSPSEAPGA